jgi:hypothetical protein
VEFSLGAQVRARSTCQTCARDSPVLREPRDAITPVTGLVSRRYHSTCRCELVSDPPDTHVRLGAAQIMRRRSHPPL